MSNQQHTSCLAPSQKTIISTYVNFLEDKEWFWNKSIHRQQQFEMKYFNEYHDNGSSSHSTTSTTQSTSRSQSTPRYRSINSSSSDGTPMKTRSLKEIYEVTKLMIWR